MSNKKELSVNAIENGTVIDHLPAKSVMHVISMLQLDTIETQIVIGTNLVSKKVGKKGIIKVSDMFFAPNEINKIALVAPNATLIEIRDYNVTKKHNVEVPKKITNLAVCANPKCITNIEKVNTAFNVSTDKEGKIILQCKYCEKDTKNDQIKFIK